jgi:integrase
VGVLGHKFVTNANDRGIVVPEANTGLPLPREVEKVARRRYQDPKPFREGDFWWLLHWIDEYADGKCIRKRKRTKLGPASLLEREAKKIAAEVLRPLNQGLISIGSAVSFSQYVDADYMTAVLPLMVKATQSRYRGIIENYLRPTFGNTCLRDLTTLTLQKYFSSMTDWKLSHESKDKIRDVMSSILGSAKQYGLLTINPMEGVRLPRNKEGRKNKPYVPPEKFLALLALIDEPYATMIYVAIYTGLRISELLALRGKNIGANSITVEQRFCRGEWSAPKSRASNATIAVNRNVIARLQRFKRQDENELVFQSRTGGPLRDNNILSRHIKPAGRKLGMPWLNWRCLRTSHATWLKIAGADIKDAQAQMRHSRASTTLDIYQQFVPESQQQAVERLSSLESRSITFQ